MKIFACVALGVILLSTNVAAQQWTTPVRVNHDKSLSSQRSPMMKIGRNGNIYVAWVNTISGTGGPILMSVSTDAGKTFTNDVTVCADANCNADFQRTAQFVLDTKDHIHMIWMGNRVKNPKTNQLQPDIWYTRSNDNGATWTTPVSISGADDSSIYAQDFPSIACDSSDNLYVTHLDSRETQRQQNSNVHLYFTKSTDGGMSWSANKKIESYTGVSSGGTCECCTENIASSPDGHLYVVFRSNISDLRNIWLERSEDRGETWAPALKVQNGDWHISECPVSGPSLTLGPDETAYVSWRDARDDSGSNKAHIYLAQIPFGSAEIPANKQMDEPLQMLANYPSIATYENGKYLAIFYQNTAAGNDTMRYAVYSGGTPVVKNCPLLSVKRGQFANILFAPDGTRYLCWQDMRDDAGDIYFCKEISPLSTASVEVAPLTKPFSVRPNPITGPNKTVTIVTDATHGTFRLVDLKGNTVKLWKLNESTGMKVDLSGFAAGYYVVVFEHDGRTESNNIEIR